MVVAETESWSRQLSGAWACHLFLNPCTLPRALHFLDTLTEAPQEPLHTPAVSNRAAYSCLSPGSSQAPQGMKVDHCPFPTPVTSTPTDLPWAEPLLDSCLGRCRRWPPSGLSAPLPASHFMTFHSSMVSPIHPCYSHLTSVQVVLTSRDPHSAHPP